MRTGRLRTTLICGILLCYSMKQRVKRVLSRARYAAIGAAIGAGVGGLVSRKAASTGGALGAVAGATVGEKRVTVDAFIDDVKEKRADRDVLESEE